MRAILNRGFTLLVVGGMMSMSLSLAGCATSSGSPQVLDLRCEDKPSPMGIDVPRPLLSWRMESSRRRTMQSGYRVLVASDPANLAPDRADLWDSGNVSSDQSLNLEYGGRALGSGQTAYWKVLVRDDQGKKSASEPATWEMGLLQPTDWQAQWIDFPSAQGQVPATTTAPATTESTQPDHTHQRHVYPPNLPPYLRKSFRH